MTEVETTKGATSADTVAPVGSRLAIPALATAAFVYVTAEGLPVGLLVPMSRGLHVPTSQIGLLVTIYAAVAGLAAVPVTAGMDGHGRRAVVTGAVTLLAVSQLIMTVAPDYEVVVAARVLGALAHGVFWSVLAPVAARLAPPGRTGRATATVFAGNSLALVVGIPAATALGQAVGWRGAMAAMAVAAVGSGLAVALTMPRLPPTGPRQSMAVVPGLLRRRTLMAVCAATALIVVGQFTAYTYITALVRRDAGVTGFAVSALLVVYGLAGVGGIVLIGRMVDGRLRAATSLAGAGLTIALAVLAGAAHGSITATVGAVALWGAAFTALPVCLQSAVLRVAPDAGDAASALYVVAFQIGIGGGALAGSTLVAAGNLASLPAVGMVFAAVGTAVVLLARGAFPAHPRQRKLLN